MTKEKSNKVSDASLIGITDAIKGMKGTSDGFGGVNKEDNANMHDVCLALLAPNKPIAFFASEPDDWKETDGKALKALEKENLMYQARVLFNQASPAGDLCTLYLFVRTDLGKQAFHSALKGEADFNRIFDGLT